MLLTPCNGQVYWPKREDIGKFLKVECMPILEETEYPPIYALSSPISRGMCYMFFGEINY